MAQSGFTPILVYSTSTASTTPSASNLLNSTLGSELAINITDGKLFYKDNANAVQVIGWKVTPTSAGGTGLTSYTAGDMLFYASGTALSKLAIGATGRYLSSTGSAPQWSAPGALTETDDTNVTLTLGGSPSTALLSAVSMTLGWTGTLAVGRGGTGASTFTAGRLLFGNTTSAINTDASIFWDNTNKRLGVGTSSPSYQLHVYNGGGNAQLGFNYGSSNTGLIQGFSAGLSLEALGAGTNVSLFANSAEIARAAAGGYFTVNGSNQGYGFLSSQTTSASGSAVGAQTSGAGAALYGGWSSTTAVYYVYGNGNVVNTNNSYGPISDVKLKENIVDATPKLDDLMKVRVVNYNLKQELGFEPHKQIGVIAQELEEIFPGLVDSHVDTDEDGNQLDTQTKSVKMTIFIPMLIKAIQEQQQIIEQLKAKVGL